MTENKEEADATLPPSSNEGGNNGNVDEEIDPNMSIEIEAPPTVQPASNNNTTEGEEEDEDEAKDLVPPPIEEKVVAAAAPRTSGGGGGAGRRRRSTFVPMTEYPVPIVEDMTEGGMSAASGNPGRRSTAFGGRRGTMAGGARRGSVFNMFDNRRISLAALGRHSLDAGRRQSALDYFTVEVEPVDPTIEADAVFRYSTDVDTEQDAEAAEAKKKLTESILAQEQKVVDGAKRLTPYLSYELVSWVVFLVLTILAIVDRFTWNVWPRQTYSIGAGSAGSDRTEGYKPGPWSVVLYDGLARVSGRYSIICYNFLLIYRLECLEHLLADTFISKYILDTSNIINANLRLHYWNGIGLCVMTILHVWSILFPCITHGYTAVVVPGVFEWPLSERTPIKCSKSDEPGCWPGDANPELKQMGLQADDVFRMVEMTLFLCILMPISVRWFATRWHAGMPLHRIINLVYFVDIVRRHSHPHSWILNTPIFVLYLFDAYVFRYHYKRNNSPEVKRVKLGDDFMVLYWKSPYGITNTIGPDYALRMNNSSFLEGQHVFTCFENRSGAMLGDEADGFDWTVGVVVRVFRRPRSPRLGKIDYVSHTQRMYEDFPAMLITGPKQGEMSEMVRLELLSMEKAPLILFGAGSAVNFIVDALQWCVMNKPNRRKICIIYTTRDYELFQWTMDCFSNLIPLCEERGVFFEVKMAFTGKGVVPELTKEQPPGVEQEAPQPPTPTPPVEKVPESADPTATKTDSDEGGNNNNNDPPAGATEVLSGASEQGANPERASTVTFDDNTPDDDEEKKSGHHHAIPPKEVLGSLKTQAMRVDLYREIYPNSTVFCQGSDGLKRAVLTVCLDFDARFYGGRGGAREDLL